MKKTQRSANVERCSLTVLATLLISSVASAQPAFDATGVEYVKKEQINDGKPIKLTYWEWSGQRAGYQRAWADAYMALYPNVEIEVVLQPFDSYWSSLITNVPAGKGPPLWHMHASKMTEFCEGELMDPIPEHVADVDFLQEHWIGFAEGAMACPDSGSVHTVPMGGMMPLLFINEDQWEKAGLTDDDVPETWEELRTVASKLTQRDARGRISVAGISMIAQEWLQNAIYQQGRYLFTAGGSEVSVNNPEYRAALQYLSDLVHEDKVMDAEVISLEQGAFVSEQAAMFIGFSWVSGFIRQNAPEMNWRAALLPTPDGEPAPAYGNVRFALEAVINPFADDDLKAVAWDFWHFNYANEQVVLDDLALFNGFVPPYDKLVDMPAVNEDAVVSTIAPMAEYGIINDLPEVIRQEQEELAQAVILSADALTDELLEESEAAQNQLLSKGNNWNIIERNYAHGELMLADD